MKVEVVKSFEGDLGNGPQTVPVGMVLEVESKGEPRYWLDMGWVVPVREKAVEKAVKEPREKAVTRRKRTTRKKKATTD